MKHLYLTALLGGLFIGLLPSWVVSRLAEAFPSLKPEELQIVSDFFSQGIGPVQITFFVIIVFLVPPIEEAIFRGGFWKLFAWKLSPYWVWILTSLLFAAVHMEPLHIIGLLPFSFFAGWLRLKSGVLGPSIVAHITNNAVGCALMML